MYEKHFGLRQRPFRSVPDCSRWYPSSTHEQALAALQQGAADEEGLLLLTGEPGLGKTLLCHCLLQRLGDEVRSAFLTNTHLPDRMSLLQSLAYELGIGHEGKSEHLLRLAVTDDLLKHCAEERHTFLIVDEAHLLGLEALEELRQLANLEGGQVRAVQILLSAHPELYQALAQPELAALRQRLAVRASLEPLSATEAADYLLHHLRMVADRPEKLLMGEALELLARGTRGVPRLLNQAAHRALTLAYQAGASTVDVEAVVEAMLALGLDIEEAASLPDEDMRQVA